MATLEEDISNAKAEIAEIRAIIKDIALAQLRNEGELRKQSEENRAFKEYVLASQQNFEARWAKLELERREETREREKERLEQEELLQRRLDQLEKEKLEREKRQTEWEKERHEMNKRWGELANKMGTLVEDIVAPNIPRIAKEHFDIQEVVDFSVRRIVKHPHDPSRIKDFDALLIGKDTIILNETKSTVRLSYIEEFIAFIPTFFEYLPQYEGKKIIPVFSSLYIPENFLAYLTKNNIYALAMGDDSMEIINLKEIQNSGKK
ncbi:MAG: hypothetical protein SFU91_11655 [Chloroherpetonaceae bacterium]|nr:hypothetical protein [Chloroherpetonaceae bacterium]